MGKGDERNTSLAAESAPGDVPQYDFVRAKHDDHFSAARILFKEYAASLPIDLCFQDFEKELNEISAQYNYPTGGLMLLTHSGMYIGCAGIRKFEIAIAELKRMYIRPEHRGSGLGIILLQKAIEFAKEKRYEKIRLDTLKSMTAAIGLYQRFGFYPIEPYRFNPSEEVLYFELKIG